MATKEAFQLYLDRLNPGGILAVHISNWHIDLNPLCKAVAKQWGGDSSKVLKFESSKVEEQHPTTQNLFRSFRVFRMLKKLRLRETDWSQVRDMALPTDACGSLISLVQYGHRPPEKKIEIDVGSLLR